MAKNITSSGSATIASHAYGILIQVNAALTGTITVAVAGSTQYGTSSATIATITNPGVGNVFRYGGLTQQGAVTVNPSATCDITVTVLTRGEI
jgi:hypothetical protein